MTRRNASEIKGLTPAWRALEANAAVKLCAVRSARHYNDMIEFMNTLIDEIGDREDHALAGLLNVVTIFVRDYEEHQVTMPQVSPSAALRVLMDQHELRQVDLAALFGSQSNVSEVLSGKRSINARQARALAERFSVSPAVFV